MRLFSFVAQRACKAQVAWLCDAFATAETATQFRAQNASTGIEPKKGLTSFLKPYYKIVELLPKIETFQFCGQRACQAFKFHSSCATHLATAETAT